MKTETSPSGAEGSRGAGKLRDRSVITGSGGLQNGKFAGLKLKLLAPPPPLLF